MRLIGVEEFGCHNNSYFAKKNMQRVVAITLSLLALILALSYNFIVEWLTLGGIGKPDVKPYEGGKCRKIEGVETCEDIIIHHRTGYAFMSCGNKTKVFYPPLGIYTETTQLLRDTPYIYDINEDKLIRLELKDFPSGEDFIQHGLGVYQDEKNEPNKLYLFFINHKRSGSVIEIFEHILNTKILTYLSTIKHDLIYSPNDVVPISKNEFYVTNDHASKFSNKFWRTFEAITRRPWSNVVFHSSITNTTEIAVDGLRHPNGIISNWDHSKIYVGTTTGGELLIYDRKSNNKLHLSDRLFLGSAIDNLSVDETGGIYCTTIPKPIAGILKSRNDKKLQFSNAIVKVTNNTAEDRFYGIKYSQEVIYEDNGSTFSTITVAAVNKQRNVMLLGSFYGVARCELDH